MRSYECTIVFHPGTSEEGLRDGTTKYASVVATAGGELTGLETWGKRRLAYEINDHDEGHYYFLRFRSDNPVLDELGRQMRIDESILRHLIVVDELASGEEPKVEVDKLEAVVKSEREEVRSGEGHQEEKRQTSRS